MKNYTKYAFLTLLVATSGLSAQPRSLRDRWNDWRFANSRVGQLLGLNTTSASKASPIIEPVVEVAVASDVEAAPIAIEQAPVEITAADVTPQVETASTRKSSAKAWFNSAKATGSSAWQSTKNTASAGWTKTKNGCSAVKDGFSKGCGWVGTQLNSGYNAAKTAVTNSFKTDAGYGHKVVKAVKDHPYVVAATAGVVSYPALKCLAKKFWNAKPNHKFGMVFVPAALVGLAAHAGVQMPQVDPRLAAAVAGGCAATGLLDGLWSLRQKRQREKAPILLDQVLNPEYYGVD